MENIWEEKLMLLIVWESYGNTMPIDSIALTNMLAP